MEGFFAPTPVNYFEGDYLTAEQKKAKKKKKSSASGTKSRSSSKKRTTSKPRSSSKKRTTSKSRKSTKRPRNIWGTLSNPKTGGYSSRMVQFAGDGPGCRRYGVLHTRSLGTRRTKYALYRAARDRACVRTSGGLRGTSGAVIKKKGRLVYKKASAAARRRYKEETNPIRLWNKAVKNVLGTGVVQGQKISAVHPMARKGTHAYNEIKKEYRRLRTKEYLGGRAAYPGYKGKHTYLRADGKPFGYKGKRGSTRLPKRVKWTY